MPPFNFFATLEFLYRVAHGHVESFDMLRNRGRRVDARQIRSCHCVVVVCAWYGVRASSDRRGQALAGVKRPPNQPPDTVDIQLIVSAGMGILQGSTVARSGGHLLNCDGWNLSSAFRSGFKGTADEVVFSNTTNDETNTYAPHSEVRRHGSSDQFLPQRVPLDADDLAEELTAKGGGNLHLYGPVELPGV